MAAEALAQDIAPERPVRAHKRASSCSMWWPPIELSFPEGRRAWAVAAWVGEVRVLYW